MIVAGSRIVHPGPVRKTQFGIYLIRTRIRGNCMMISRKRQAFSRCRRAKNIKRLCQIWHRRLMYFILSSLLIQNPFQFQAGSEAAEESAVARHVLRKGLAGGGGGVGKNPVLQKSLQGFPLLPQNHKGGK